MKHYICGAVCGGVAATALWLSGSSTLWSSLFSDQALDSDVKNDAQLMVSGNSSESPVASHLTASHPSSGSPSSSHSYSGHSATSQPTTDIGEADLLGPLTHSPVEKQADPPPTSPKPVEPPAAIVCVGTAFGASCLVEDGEWVVYTPENSELSVASIVDVAVCSNETVVFAHAAGIDILRGDRWSAIDAAEIWGADNTVSMSIVECLSDGSIWVGHDNGLSQFDGSDWTHFEREVLGTSESGPVDITEDLNQHLWVLTPHSIAKFDGRNWTSYSPGAGLPEQAIQLVGIAIGDNGWPRARDGEFNRSLRFNGERWVVRDVDQPAGVTGFAIDARDSEWVGSESEGAWVYSRGGAVVQDRDSSNLSSNQIFAIATDESGRTWLGTSWGLNVFDGRDWTVYHMHTAELPDNRILAIDVAGEGPELPDPMTKDSGTLVGNLLQTGQPIADTLVEVCADSLGRARRGPSPCINQSEFYAAITDVDGRFVFSALPTGRYTLAFLNDGEWTQIETELSAHPLSRIFIAPGKTANIGSLDVTPLSIPHN